MREIFVLTIIVAAGASLHAISATNTTIDSVNLEGNNLPKPDMRTISPDSLQCQILDEQENGNMRLRCRGQEFVALTPESLDKMRAISQELPEMKSQVKGQEKVILMMDEEIEELRSQIYRNGQLSQRNSKKTGN